MQVDLMQIEAVKSILKQAEADIFEQTNTKVRLLIAANKIQISFSFIAGLVKEICNVTESQLLGPRNSWDIVDARRIVALILKDYVLMTYSEIARQLNKKDHATIMNLITTARSFIKNRDARFYPKVTAVLTILDSQIILNKIQ